MHSRQVMTPHVTVVSPATAISEIARKMRDEDIGVTLVVEKNRLIGVVTGGETVTRFVPGTHDSGSATAREVVISRRSGRDARERGPPAARVTGCARKQDDSRIRECAGICLAPSRRG